MRPFRGPPPGVVPPMGTAKHAAKPRAQSHVVSTTSSARFSSHAGAKLMQRNRAASAPDSRDFDYIRDEVARRLVDRLGDITRDFPVAVDLGANAGNVARALRSASAKAAYGGSSHAPGRDATSGQPSLGGVRALHLVEPSERMLFRDAGEWPGGAARTSELIADSRWPFELAFHAQDIEAARLPFPDASVDLVLSSCALHWVNDLPGLLGEVRRVLRPDGAFLAAMLGGETLQELRESFYSAEMAEYGGVSPHVSPMVGVADAGNLLSAAGFGLPTVDTDTFTVEYPDPWALFRHLRSMGESNAALGRQGGMRRRLLEAASRAYTKEYGLSDGSIPATFQVIYMIGWAPAPTQPLAKARGSVPKGFGMRKSAPKAD